MPTKPVTQRINEIALKIIEKKPEGVRWSELIRLIKAKDKTFHPKTVNGCVWKLAERFPDRVYKPEKGLFRGVRYKAKR